MKTKNSDLRIQRGEETRASLIKSTISAVAQNGLSGTTLNVVAEIAGVSRALVGFHFSSKEQLLDAALESALDTYDNSLKTALAAAESPLAKISVGMVHDVHFAETHQELLSLWFAAWGEVRVTKKYRLSLLPMDQIYRDEIAKDLTQLLKNKDEAKYRAMMLDAYIYGVWLECHIDPSSYDLDKHLLAAEKLVQLVTSQP